MQTADDDRYFGQRHDRSTAAGHRVEQQPRAAFPRGFCVAMRIGLPGDEAVGAFDHGTRHMGMQVEGGHHGNLAADELTHGADDVSLRVVYPFGDGRSVHRQQHAVYWECCPQAAEEFVAQAAVTGGRDTAPRAGAGAQQWCHVDACLRQNTKRASHNPRVDGQHVISPAQLVALEPLHVYG